ncbi:MAG TPA: hypothetical protein VHC72_15175 [Bryobacteraceae bacterium]|nr:hypothetical protein [Bryobacteraceae bacterium]
MRFRKFIAPVFVVSALLYAVTAGIGASSVSIALQNGAFRVSGWSAPSSPPGGDWGRILSVYTGAETNLPAVLGSYSVEQGTLVFRPRYPVAAGVNYRVVFHPPGGAVVEKRIAGPPRPVNPVARVTAVYPSADALPANLLRFYIWFSAPMSKGEAAARLHLLDSKGKPLPAVFLSGEELWDPAGTRLTMTLDPGRIKRGLTSNMALGAAIVDGRRYTLAIDKEWNDARGVAMVEGFRKAFRGAPADRTPPDPKQWRITPPRGGTRDALVVAFGEPLNHALLERMLRVDIAGRLTIPAGETEWRFVPDSPWRAGAHRLMVNTAIEDLAGNRPGLPFDVDVFQNVTEHIATTTMTLPFTIR